MSQIRSDDVSSTLLSRLASVARRSPLARDAGKLSVARMVVLAAGFVQAAVVAHELGPREYGVAALVLAYPMFVYTVFDPQASDAVVKYLGEANAQADDERSLSVVKLAYALDAVLAVLGFAVVAATSSWAASSVVHSTRDTGLIIVAAAAVAVGAPSDTSRAVLTTLGRFRGIAWVEGSTGLARGALVIALVVTADAGVAGVVWGTAAGVLAEGVCMAVLAHSAQVAVNGRSWTTGRLAAVRGREKEMARFLAYTNLTSLAAVLVKQVDLVFLGYTRGSVDAGWYRLARALTAPFGAVTAPLQAVAYPRFSRLAALGDATDARRTVRRYIVGVGLPLGCLSLGTLALVPTAIRVVAGPDYLPATGAARWLIAGSAFVLMFFWARPAMYAAGQVRFVFVVTVVTASATVAGVLLTANAFGTTGVAASRTFFASIAGTALITGRYVQLSRRA